ncbi:Pol polyprotein [Cricetulus griseus]|nr:Pol polyprotein [Cricetulus griseus]
MEILKFYIKYGSLVTAQYTIRRVVTSFRSVVPQKTSLGFYTSCVPGVLSPFQGLGHSEGNSAQPLQRFHEVHGRHEKTEDVLDALDDLSFLVRSKGNPAIAKQEQKQLPSPQTQREIHPPTLKNLGYIIPANLFLLLNGEIQTSECGAENPQVTLLQYVDDLLLAAPTKSECSQGTEKLLTELDGSSFVVEGKRKAGAAVVDGKQVIWASSLPEGTSAQKAELVALIQALRMAERKSINIYTDSRQKQNKTKKPKPKPKPKTITFYI